jgi:hypothetical protein
MFSIVHGHPLLRRCRPEVLEKVWWALSRGENRVILHERSLVRGPVVRSSERLPDERFECRAVKSQTELRDTAFEKILVAQ